MPGVSDLSPAVLTIYEKSANRKVPFNVYYFWIDDSSCCQDFKQTNMRYYDFKLHQILSFYLNLKCFNKSGY